MGQSNKNFLSTLIHGEWTPFFLLFFLCLLKIPYLHLPVFWDEILVYVGPASHLNQNGLLRAIPWRGEPSEFFFHPPGFPLTLAVFYRIFGESIGVTRSVALGLTYFSLCFVYLLGKEIFDKTTGLLAALFTFSTPIILAQSTLFLGDLGLMATGLGHIYYALKRKWGKMVFWGIYCACTRESALAIVLPVNLYFLWFIAARGRKKERKSDFLAYALSFLPLYVLAGFFLYQKTLLGQWSGHMAAQDFQWTWTVFTGTLGKICQWIFWAQDRGIFSLLTLTMVPVLLATGRSGALKKPEIFLLVGIIASFIGGFSFDKGALNRYFNPVLPLFFLLGLGVWTQTLFQKKGLLYFLGALHFFLGPFRFHSSPNPNTDDMSYVEIIRIHTEGARFLEDHFPGKTVAATWPIICKLENPAHGYVEKKIRVEEDLENAHDLVVFSNDTLPDFAQKALLQVHQGRIKLVKKFSQGNFDFSIYRRI